MENATIQRLLEEGFKEISNEAIRKIDFKEIVEYYDGKKWRMFAKR